MSERIVRLAAVFAGCALTLLGAAACSGGSSAPHTTPTPGATAAGSPQPSAAAAKPSSGCGNAAPLPAGGTTQTIEAGGQARTYRRYIPAGAGTTPLPLVINIHGLGSNADQQTAFAAFEPLADQQHFIVLAPQALGTLPQWNMTPGPTNVDIPFLKAMLDEVEGSACVDTAREYSTGLSDGGIMSSVLACELGDRLAAVGLVSGIRPPATCAPGSATPMVVFWGKQDMVLPYCGGVGPVIAALFSRTPVGNINALPTPVCPPVNSFGFPPVEDVVGQWVAHDGCSPKAATSQAGSDVEHRVFSGCAGGSAVEFYVVSDGGHSWPGSKLLIGLNGATGAAAILGHTTDQVDATAVIWAFFQRFARAG